MARRSAGLVLFRRVSGQLEVLVGHMGGPYWAHRDAGAWTIPKGEYDAGEDPHDAAVREFTEELGIPPPPGEDIALGEVRQRSKVVTAWAREADLDPQAVSVAGPRASVELEWPPRSGHRIQFPELDHLEWMPLESARERVISGQAELLNRLEEAVGAGRQA